jgi:hypothetical protein
VTQDRLTLSVPANAPDASDVVDGPIGAASLKDPARSGPIGADIESLEPIDIPTGEQLDMDID